VHEVTPLVRDVGRLRRWWSAPAIAPARTLVARGSRVSERGPVLSREVTDPGSSNHRPHPEEIDRYLEAWAQSGAAPAMINCYRCSVRQPPKEAKAADGAISVPAFVIWGRFKAARR
jgi:pimeloyl-ACP methyl ester carboxylesterase